MVMPDKDVILAIHEIVRVLADAEGRYKFSVLSSDSASAKAEISIPRPRDVVASRPRSPVRPALPVTF